MEGIIREIPKGFWIRRVKNTNIFKFRINSGDRCLFTYERFLDDTRHTNRVVFIEFVEHDKQIVHANRISNIDICSLEYQDDDVEDSIDKTLTEKYYGAKKIIGFEIKSDFYINELIDARIDLNKKDDFGMTAFMWSLESGNLAIVRELLIAGVGIFIRDNINRTALQIARDRRHKKIVRVLSKLLNSSNTNSVINGITKEYFEELIACPICGEVDCDCKQSLDKEYSHDKIMLKCGKCGKEWFEVVEYLNVFTGNDPYCEDCRPKLTAKCKKCGKEELKECFEVWEEEEINNNEYVCDNCMKVNSRVMDLI